MDNKKFICNFCNKTLASKGSLFNHINKSKKCIESRRENKKNKTKIFSCNLCNKVLSTKYRLQTHMKTHDKDIYKKECEEKLKEMKKKMKEQKQEYEQKLEKQKQEYEQEIRYLQDKLENIAIKAVTKQRTINQNHNMYIQNNLESLKEEDFTKYLEYFTQDTILDG